MKIVKKKSESVWRWAILLLTCTMMIGNYYCYDIPAALNSQMDDYFGKPGDFETLFSLLYTVYSVPNVILPFFGGYFVDRLGVRLCLIIFALAITVGQLVVAVGLSAQSWPIMFVGRVLYGLGGENLGVANSAILSIWFEGKELALAFGLNLSIARLGSVINNLVSPELTNSINIQFAFWFGVILCGGSVASCLVISSIDKHLDSVMGGQGHHSLLATEDGDPDNDKEIEERNKVLRKTVMDKAEGHADVLQARASIERSPSFASEPTAAQEVSFRDALTFKQIFWVLTLICVVVYGCVLPFNNIASALLLERDYFKEPDSACHLTYTNQCQSDSNPPVNCPSSKWYQPPLPTNYTAADVDCTDDYFSDYCTVTFCNRQSDAQVQASTIMSIPYIISACLSPVLGGFVDRFGARAIIATASPLALVVVHIFLGFTTVSPIGPLVGQGLAYSCFAAVLWPSVGLVIEQRLVGLGYGIVVSVQNMGLASFPLIIAAIYSGAGDQYIPEVEIFFIACAWIGVIVGLYLNYVDYYFMDSILNGIKKRRLSMEELEAHHRASLTNPLFDDEEKVKTFGPNDRIVEAGRNSEGTNQSTSRHRSSELFSTSMIH
mmetsp:Transcript_19281/g.20895  ORF Transcript_19281/g.20895 Transcript_19281/m.20895 type:complete len:607 (+) Transcript_19281:100-1920(+)|eukprot:gene13017-14278_t